MVPDPSSPEVREALEELQLYLSDILPPLVVADAFKVFLIGEFRLVPRGPFEPFLEELKKLALEFAPEAEREALRANLERIAESKGALTASVDALIRQMQGVPQAAAAPIVLSPEDLRGFRRFSLLLERLGRQIQDAGVPEAGGSPDVLAAALAAAARSSHGPQELERNLEKLREIGLETKTSSIFRVLANSLPGWVPPEPPPAATTEGAAGEPAAGPPFQTPPESGAVETMHRIVAQSEDPAQLAMRFSEMVKTAVERFNEGALPQAVRMLDLAERIVRENSVDTAMVEAVRSKGDEALDLERLRKFSEAQRYHALLRRFLGFFVATSPKGLLNKLIREMKRERRKLILQLLEVHGPPARQEALDRLQSAFGQAEGDEKWYYRRNLLYLLRRISPIRTDVVSEEDVNAAVRHAVLRFPAPLVKEAVANLGQLKHEKAESTLVTLLEDLEKMLLKPVESSYDPREIRLLLDRVVAALARFGTAGARRAVVDHGLKKKAALGDTVARLSELAGQDLSGDAEVVERLLAALKASSPHRVLGIVVHPNDLQAKHIIEALSTTPSPPVRQAFEGLANRFPNQEVGIAAANALESLDGAARIREAPYDTRSGELELFGLPALMQNLAESGTSGLLTLKDAAGEITGEVVLSGGKIKSCEARGLKGEEAFYQLLEKPTAGSFVFERRAGDESSKEDSGSLLEVQPLCVEGMRRYDELQQAAALVPDDLKLKPTDVRPEPHPDEQDGMVVNRLWKLASGGATPGDCDGALTADSYRIRRQLAFWVESGALTA